MVDDDARRVVPAIPDMAVHIGPAAVLVRSARPLQVLSSAMVGGGYAMARDFVNMRVDDVRMDACPEEQLRVFAATLGIAEPFVGLMTAAKTQDAQVVEESWGALAAFAVVSVGLSNRTSAGLSPPVVGRVPSPGTINAMVFLDGALSPAALVNAVITATEAKSAALTALRVHTDDGLPATGTSTDSVVVACSGRGVLLDYAGPATAAGWLIARTVREAVSRVSAKLLVDDGT